MIIKTLSDLAWGRFRIVKGKSSALSLLLIMLSLAVSSCGFSLLTSSDTDQESAQHSDPVALKFMFFGDKPIDMDDVLQEFEKKTKDSLNVRIDIDWNAPEEYKQKIKLTLAAGEVVDAVFDASWMNLEQNVSQGFYWELDSYFNNDAYPGLKKAFPPDYLENNKIGGHLYAIPLTQFFRDIEVVFIRKDLREQFGLEPIESYEDLQAYLEAVRRNRPDMVPFALKGDRGFFRMFQREDKQNHFRAGTFSLSGTGIDFQVVLSKDGKKVLAAMTYGDPVTEYAGFPAPLNDPDYFYGSLDRYVEWNKYVQKDVLNERNPFVLFVNGKTAANESTISGWNIAEQMLKSTLPGAELEAFVYSDCTRNMEKGCIGTDYKAWNNLAIPVTSKHVEQTMKFLDWLFGSQENHDLFELGIEGRHWKKGTKNTYRTTTQSINYHFPSYELTWNPVMSRINADNDPMNLELLRYTSDPDTYYRLPLSGFVFNPAPVKTEVVRVQAAAQPMVQMFKSGLDPDWRDTAAKTNNKLRALGLDNIRAELIRQVQAYLDNGGT